MIRTTTLLILSFIFLCFGEYAHAQLSGPGTRPHNGTYQPGTPAPATVPGTTPSYIPRPGTTPSYIPQTPVYVPNSPAYIPSGPAYSPGYYNQSQVQAELNNVRQQEAQLRAELRQLEAQDRALRSQLQTMYQPPAYNGYYNGQTEEGRGNEHHDHGKHLGWYKHGHGGGDN